MVGDSGQHIGEPDTRIDAVQLRRDDKGNTSPRHARQHAVSGRAAMKCLLASALVLLIVRPTTGNAAEQRVPWDRVPRAVSEALHALRQTDHWLAEAMAEHLDGSRQGRDTEAGRSRNFDPSRHLLCSVHDLNGDGRPEVFLLFPWPYVRGIRRVAGIATVRTPRDEWRIGCEISDWGDEGPRGGVRLLASRSNGWRKFRTSDAVSVWRPVAGQAWVTECVPSAPVPTQRQGSRAP